MAPRNLQQGHSPSYSPLDRNGREIRLIEILSTSPRNILRCKLHTVTLTSNTYYVCLSYVWGDPETKETIIVDGVPQKVTVTLAAALKHLKRHWIDVQRESGISADASKLRVWADALCINQNDLRERTHQVGLMADIYSTAEMVLAWLSSDDRDVAAGFEVLERVYRDVEHLPHGLFAYSFAHEDFIPLSWLFTYDGKHSDKTLASIGPEEPFSCLSKLWKLSFWSRVWIQQEVILAKRLYFVSPSKRMSLKSCVISNREIQTYLRYGLAALLKLLENPPDERRSWQEISRSLFGIPTRPEQIITLLECQRGTAALLGTSRNERDHLNHETWGGFSCSSLFLSGHLQATDNLDYVYGLLAVIPHLPIAPDYTKSIKEVYMEFARWVVIQLPYKQDFTGFLDANSVGLRQLHGLPTWAPVFAPDEKRKSFNFKHFIPPEFQPWVLIPCLSQGLNQVTVRGTSLWSLAIPIKVIKSVYPEPFSERLFRDRLRWFVEDLIRAYGSFTYTNGRPILEIVCCALLLKVVSNYDVNRFWFLLRVYGQIKPAFFAPDFDTEYYTSELDTIVQEWQFAAQQQSGSRMFTTTDGYIGLTKDEILRGDIVFSVAGYKHLTILRPKDNHYLFVGTSMLQSFDDGIYYKKGGNYCRPMTIEIR